MSKTQKARDFLEDLLGDKAVPTREIYEEAKAAGIADRTLRTAKKQLQVQLQHINAQPHWILRSVEVGVESETRLRTYAASLEKTIRFWDMIGEKFIQAVREQPPLQMFPSTYTASKTVHPETIVHMIGDVQIGQKMTLEETGGLGAYDSAILLDQMEFYKESVAHILNRYHPDRKVGKVFLMGDMVDGTTIFLGQQRAVDLPAVKQVVFGANLFADLMNDLSQHYEWLDIYAIIGNHGRIGKKGECHPLDNLDWLVYQFMRELLRKNKKVRFHISESWFQLVDVEGWRFCLTHGDDVGPSYLGIPFYAAFKSEGKMQTLLKNIAGEIGGFDFFNLAHHHTKAEFENIFMNGAWPPGSEFSLKRLQRSGVPSQKMYAVHPKYGITWRRDVQLQEPGGKEVRVYK